MRQPLNTNTVVAYAYSVTVNGQKIGNLQGFTPSYNRELQRVREIGNTTDDIKEIVAGRGEFTITLDRLESHDANFAQSMTLRGDNVVPSNQASGFSIVEKISTGSGGRTRTITYTNCWIQSYSKTVREGTLTVAENVVIWPTKVVVSTPAATDTTTR